MQGPLSWAWTLPVPCHVCLSVCPAHPLQSACSCQTSLGRPGLSPFTTRWFAFGLLERLLCLRSKRCPLLHFNWLLHLFNPRGSVNYCLITVATITESLLCARHSGTCIICYFRSSLKLYIWWLKKMKTYHRCWVSHQIQIMNSLYLFLPFNFLNRILFLPIFYVDQVCRWYWMKPSR